MFKPSRRAVVVAASFALGLSCVGPYAHAAILGGNTLPVVGGLPVGDLLGDGLLGGDLPVVGDVLGGDLLGGDLPIVGDVLGGDLLGGDLPIVGDVLGGDSPLAAEGAVDVLADLPDLGVVPGGGSPLAILEAFSDSGSIVPGLQVLDEFGVLGILGSL